jgi:hypothetical protein
MDAKEQARRSPEQEEKQVSVAETLKRIKQQRRWLRPLGAPDSTALLREDRDR